MKKTNLKSIISVAAALMLCMMFIAGCSRNTTNLNNTELASGGVLCLKVNPEIAITYDADGLVTKIDARNDDAKKLIESYTGFEGKECKTVVTELVNKIGEAGYFVEEIEGQRRRITIEIEPGSKIPDRTFLDEVVTEVRNTVNSNKWNSPLEVRGESDYGITDYVDTDYGPDNDGVTDYNDTDYGPNNDGVTDYGPNNDGVTDYNDTDYGPNNDGVTDYNNTDYGPNNDGVTDYNNTDYGPNNDGVTDYNNTNYGNSNYGNTNYDGNSNYGDSGYRD